MRFLFFILVCWGLVNTGCRPVQPVSSFLKDANKDSTTHLTTTEKIDSSYQETGEIKTTPSGKVDVGFSKAQFDSLLVVLATMKSLPVAVRTIYKIDPTTHQQLKLFMDSVGRIHFQCLQEGQQYWQRYIHERTQKEKLETQLTLANTKIKSQSNEIVQAKKGLLERLKEGFDHWLVKLLIWFILVGIGVMIVEYGLAYLKNIKWLSTIFNFLTFKKRS